MDDNSFEYLDITMAALIEKAEAHLRQNGDLRETNPPVGDITTLTVQENSTDESLGNNSNDTILYMTGSQNESTGSGNNSNTSRNNVEVVQNSVLDGPVLLENSVSNETDDCIVIGHVNLSTNVIDLCSPGASTVRRRRRRTNQQSPEETIVILDDTQNQDEPILIPDTQDLPLPNTSTPVPVRNTTTANNASSRSSPTKRNQADKSTPDDISPGKRTRSNNATKMMNLSQEEDAGQPINCPICLDSLFKKKLASTICGHLFCHECIKEAIKITKKCPMCKKTLKLSQIHPIYLN